MARPKTPPADSPLTVSQFVTSAVLAVPMAGLLAASPELADQALTAAEWRARLDDYLASERP